MLQLEPEGSPRAELLAHKMSCLFSLKAFS